MDRTDAVKAQPEMLMKNDGDFWGFAAGGHFDYASKYKGKYSRSASKSSWFNRISFKEGAMGAGGCCSSDEWHNRSANVARA